MLIFQGRFGHPDKPSAFPIRGDGHIEVIKEGLVLVLKEPSTDSTLRGLKLLIGVMLSPFAMLVLTPFSKSPAIIIPLGALISISAVYLYHKLFVKNDSHASEKRAKTHRFSLNSGEFTLATEGEFLTINMITQAEGPNIIYFIPTTESASEVVSKVQESSDY